MNAEQLIRTAVHGDPMDAISAIHELREILKQTERNHVLTLRRHDASWAFIARQLGITRQASNDYYSRWETPTQTRREPVRLSHRQVDLSMP